MFSDTREKLKAAGVLKKHDGSGESDTATLGCETSVDPKSPFFHVDLDVDPKSPFFHVDLWPVFEHICIVLELAMLPAVWTDCPVSTSHLTDFAKQFTPGLEHRWVVAESDRSKRVTVVRKVMKRLWSCAATKNTDRWLGWYSDLEEEAPAACRNKVSPVV